MSLRDRIRRTCSREMAPQPAPAEDALRATELVAQGGSWSGLLFDNPGIGLPPALTWTFDIQFGEVSRSHGDAPVSLTVDWVPLPGAEWSQMAGQSASCHAFAEPVECSAYFFAHHRYDAVRVRVLEQQAGRLRVAVEVHGDVDGLGIPAWICEQWLDFDGIDVQLSGVGTIEEAAARLRMCTDISGLVGVASGHTFSFVRAGSATDGQAESQ